MKDIKVELLAPAGSYDSLRAAINAGADAVYIGGSVFGARAFADNLDEENMLKAIDYVHLHGKKLYLTVNTLLKNDEIRNQLFEYLHPLYKQGLDAVIVQDMGVFKFIRENFPDLDIHASTQMTVTGVYSAKMLKEAGATRVVTARELSLDELKKIHDNVDIEIESFIHGALCYCYSGQCLLSSMLGGRSGNRGRCAQPCRLPYDVTGKNMKNNDNEKYVLSPKDMCTLEIIPDIIESGVYSMKIEGRMKSPEYVAGVVEMYRKYIDMYISQGRDGFRVDENDYQKLTSLYSRNGFSQGYYKQHNGRNMISLSKATYNSVNEERINTLHDKYVSQDKKLPININAVIKAEMPMEISVQYGDIKITVKGDIPQPSNNRPATVEDISKQLKKLGNTPFECADMDIELDEGLFVPVKVLNELRRNGVNQLEHSLTDIYRRNSVQKCTDISDKKSDTTSLKLVCSVETKEQFDVVVRKTDVESIYVSVDFISDDIIKDMIDIAHGNGKKCFVIMPYIFMEGSEKYINPDILNADGYVIKNLDEMEFLKDNPDEKVADYSMYTMNNEAKSFYKENGITSCTVPYELNSHEIAKRDNAGDQMIVYGYTPLMISAGCVKKTLKLCDNNSSTYILRDRYKKNFKVKTSCKFCYNVIYNSLPLSLISCSKQILNFGLDYIRLNFTFETADEVSDITDMYIESFIHQKEISYDIGEHTKGHFKRKVD